MSLTAVLIYSFSRTFNSRDIFAAELLCPENHLSWNNLIKCENLEMVNLIHLYWNIIFHIE